MEQKHYTHLALMAGLSFIAMYILMYAMVNSIGNVYSNLNEAYMAALMTAPMVLIELAVMRSMYSNAKLNMPIIIGAVVVGVGSWTFIREQTAISDKQFLRSMIPHHAGAILMCENAPITDPQVQKLCRAIIRGQQAEIDQMKQRLKELEGH